MGASSFLLKYAFSEVVSVADHGPANGSSGTTSMLTGPGAQACVGEGAQNSAV
jgi:hypothetical protein